MLRRLLTSVAGHRALQQEGEGHRFLIGLVSPCRCVTRSTVSAAAALCVIPWRWLEGLQLIMDALQVTEGPVHQCRWHNVFVRKLVLWAWVKARVSVGENQYTLMAHSAIRCLVTTIKSTLTLTLSSITTPSNKQGMPSFDAEGIEWLESIHDQLQSLKSPAQSIRTPRIRLVISKPSRWEEIREGEGGHEDSEGHWVHEEIGS